MTGARTTQGALVGVRDEPSEVVSELARLTPAERRTMYRNLRGLGEDGIRTFLDEISFHWEDGAHNGVMRPVGITSIARGEELTLLARPNGEWVTLRRSGQGMADRIESFFRVRF